MTTTIPQLMTALELDIVKLENEVFSMRQALIHLHQCQVKLSQNVTTKIRKGASAVTKRSGVTGLHGA